MTDAYLAYHVKAYGGTNYHTDYKLIGVYANAESAKIACQKHVINDRLSTWVIEWEEEKRGIIQPKEHYGYYIEKKPVIDLVGEKA